MKQIFLTILNMNFIASYCIIAVILLRFLLRRQPKIFSYLLWSVVLFRLLCPFSPSSSYSLLRIDTNLLSGNNAAIWETQDTEGDEEEAADGQLMAQGIGQTMDAGNVQAAMRDDAEMEERGIWIWLENALPIVSRIWLIGMVLLLGYSAVATVRVYRSLKGAGQAEGNQYETDGISTPFVFGIIRPRIYLPVHLQDEEKRYVIEHEKIHIARKDYLIKMLAYAAVCIHWFNPLVWLAFILMETDMEMSCDEAVLKKLGSDVKKEYSMALLSLATDRVALQGGPLAFGEGKVKGRVNNVLSYRKRALPVVILAGVLLIAVGAGLILNPIQEVLAEPMEIAESAPAALMDMIENYAEAFGNRDGAAVVDLYIDEETALNNVFMLEKEGGTYSLGLSSPWVESFRYTLDQEENTADIYFYTMVSDPHIFVWKEKVGYIWINNAETEADEYKLTEGSLQFLDSITTKEEFDEAYLIHGKYQFVDFEELGFVDSVNFQREDATSAVDNTVYETPQKAAEHILNLKDGEGSVEGEDGMRATVRYTFTDGSEVIIPMYDANRPSHDAASSGREMPVWIVDIEAWSTMTP